MLQYKIPQDVERADKILGPLTLKQLIIVACGGGVSYGIFLIISESYYLGIFDYFLLGLPLLFALAFAFFRINDVSFLKWIMLLFEYGHNAQRRHWDKNETARLHFAFVSAKSTTPEKAAPVKKKIALPGKRKFSSLEEITYLLDHSSNFQPEEKVAPDDHDEDLALHLSASEKARHEERLAASIAAPRTSAPVTAAPPALATENTPNKTPAVMPQVNSEKTEAAPKSVRSNGQAIDTVQAPTESFPQRISFSDLQKGGTVSFS